MNFQQLKMLRILDPPTANDAKTVMKISTMNGVTDFPMKSKISAPDSTVVYTFVAPVIRYGDKLFVLDAKLGSGAYGAVYRVRDVDIKTGKIADTLALKVQENASVAMHQSAVCVELALAPEGSSYSFRTSIRGKPEYAFLMPLHKCTFYERYMSSRVAPRFSHFIQEILQLILFVDRIHSDGFLHTDIKLDNIMIAKNDAVVVIDFGISIKPGTQLPVIDMISRTKHMHIPTERFGTRGSTIPATVAYDYYSVAFAIRSIAAKRYPVEFSQGLALANAVVAAPPEHRVDAYKRFTAFIRSVPEQLMRK